MDSRSRFGAFLLAFCVFLNGSFATAFSWQTLRETGIHHQPIVAEEALSVRSLNTGPHPIPETVREYQEASQVLDDARLLTKIEWQLHQISHRYSLIFWAGVGLAAYCFRLSNDHVLIQNAALFPSWILKMLIDDFLNERGQRKDATAEEFAKAVLHKIPTIDRRELLRLTAFATGQMFVKAPPQFAVPDHPLRLTQKESLAWLPGKSDEPFDGRIHFEINIPHGAAIADIVNHWGRFSLDQKKEMVASITWPGRVASEILARAGNRPAAGIAAYLRSSSRSKRPTLNIFRAREWEDEMILRIIASLRKQLFIKAEPGQQNENVRVFGQIMESDVEEIVNQFRNPSPELIHKIDQKARALMDAFLEELELSAEHGESDKSEQIEEQNPPTPESNDVVAQQRDIKRKLNHIISQPMQRLIAVMKLGIERRKNHPDVLIESAA